MISDSELEFMQAVWRRRPVFTYVFFGLNILVFLLMEFAGGATSEPVLLAFGVKSNAMIDQGQYWRFLTPVFIHIGLLHLGFNSYALWIVGPQVEKLYGGARFVLLYLATGIAGVAASYWYHPQSISAGASGAIFGLFGVLLMYGIRHRHHIPRSLRRAVGTGVLPVIIINLIIGFSIPAIDNSAHVGGLLAGMALAAAIPFESPSSRPSVIFTLIQYALLAAVVASFYEVATHYSGPRIAVSNFGRDVGAMFGARSTSEEFIDVVNDAEHAFTNSVRALNSGTTSEMNKSAAEMAKAIDELKNVPSLGANADRLTGDLLHVMQEEYALIEDARRQGSLTPDLRERLYKNRNVYDNTLESLTQWVNSEGPQYGIQLRQHP